MTHIDYSPLTNDPEYKQAVKDWKFLKDELENIRNKEYLAFKKITDMETNWKVAHGIPVKN
jgi:hypothetical protein